MKINKTLNAALAGSALALLAVSGSALADSHEATTTYKFGGYIKFDAMFSDYSSGSLASNSSGGQFYIPATIPTGTGSGDTVTNFQARESRINFASNTTLPSGDKFSTFIEMDFFLSPGGNERVSNSYQPRLRHAFFKYNNWLFGQTWSTFQDVGALPENLDFVGPAEGTTFVRQSMIRYTSGAWEIAVENPETTLTENDGTGRVLGRDGVPDVIARYTAKVGDGYIKAAGMMRQLQSERGDPVEESDTGFGLSVSGKHPFDNGGDLRWMATFGEGTGRYLGLNTANDAAITDTGEIEAIEQFGAFVSYRHPWNDKWRSNFTYGFLQNDHDLTHVSDGVTKDVYSVHVNLLTSPLPKLTIGGEIMFAERKLENGDKGDMTRFLLSAKYAF